MYQAKENYWPDVAHIAERVLTVNELLAFVDKYVPAPSPSAPTTPKNAGRDSADAELRNLLARRLMRAGQYQKRWSILRWPKIETPPGRLSMPFRKRDTKQLRRRAGGKRR